MPDVTIYHNPRCAKSRQTLDPLIVTFGLHEDLTGPWRPVAHRAGAREKR